MEEGAPARITFGPIAMTAAVRAPPNLAGIAVVESFLNFLDAYRPLPPDSEISEPLSNVSLEVLPLGKHRANSYREADGETLPLFERRY